MAVSFASLKGNIKNPFKVHHLFVDGGVAAGGTPKYPLIGLNPTEPPTNYAEGAIYYDDDNHCLTQRTDSGWEEVGAGVVSAASFGSTVTATGAIAGPRKVYNAVTTLTNADSGAFCLFSTAAGYTYTLPTPVVGTFFDFYVGITITSSAAKILTPANVFLLGNFIQSTDGTYTSASHAADGTTIRSWNGNGSTTGGLIGDWVRVVAISTTQYSVWGMGRATGTEATPFATS